MRVRANGDRPDLVAALNQVGGRQDVRLLQNVVQVDHNHAPTVIFQLQRHLGHEAVGSGEVLVKIAQGDPDAVRSFGHPKVEMVAEGKAVARTLDLEVNVSASQAEILHSALRMWHLNVVVRRDGALDLNGSPADFLGLHKRFKVKNKEV